jgi:hypothetical protein
MRPDLNHFTRPRRRPALGDFAEQLRELPCEAEAPYDFAEFQRRSRERSAPKRQLVTWPYAAAAAGLAAFVAAMALLGTGSGANDDVGPAQIGPGTAAVVPPPRSNAEDDTSPPSLGASSVGSSVGSSASSVGSSVGSSASSVGSSVSTASSASSVASNAVAAVSVATGNDDPSDQARAAREWLARQPAEPALVRAGPRLAAASLEDRIAWFDDALTDQRLHGASPAQLKMLQQERARLVSSLAQVRFAEALVAHGS